MQYKDLSDKERQAILNNSNYTAPTRQLLIDIALIITSQDKYLSYLSINDLYYATLANGDAEEVHYISGLILQMEYEEEQFINSRFVDASGTAGAYGTNGDLGTTH